MVLSDFSYLVTNCLPMFRSIITGIGSYIPEKIQGNKDFVNHHFYGENHHLIEIPTETIVEKFKGITGIEERRYASEEMNTSDIAALASKAAIEDSGIDPETIDQIILAHNFGDVQAHTIQCDAVPALASRVKHLLGIKNPNCIAYDILFGCPGWVQGLIQADAFFKAGIAKKALVIGAETLSRIIDPHDRDSMIFADGAGASIVEYKETTAAGSGILGSAMVSHCMDEAYYINMGPSYKPGSDQQVRFIKMKGRKVYEYAMKHVPPAMKECLDRSGVTLAQVKKIFIHQANEKMDEGILQKLYKLSGVTEIPLYVMPMSIQWLGNSSVATVPTLYDLVIHGKMENQHLETGDLILFASVGAGMNINAVCYRV
jgi:3-oxoacyl-[acyl-carrier-protein] synthase-3